MRLTIFDLLHGMAIVAGGTIGARAGFKWFGYPGGAVGCVLGATLGFLVGYASYRLLDLLMVRRIRSKSTAELRAKLVDDDIPGTYVSRLIISVLLERGEPVESFREYVFRQLRSEDVTWRRAGLCNLGLCYPDLAAKLEAFDAFQPTKEDLQRLKEIEPAPDDG
ncbi:MAG TPA: hypothetical protein VMV10_25085 [Pirellulales bacterium]|nr:hypothetical protein [Pirellulales bacterium]